MFLRMVYDEKLAQASYVVGCQRSGEAIVFDPARDVDRYIEVARANGLRLVGAAETHIHADFLSGVRELHEGHGAHAYVSAEGGEEWRSKWLERVSGERATFLRDGDVFEVGGVRVEVMHTPGHTPEHVCYLITDTGSGATEPMGVISGDFVFVGDLGRPDLLESAAGQVGAAEPSAHALYSSVRRFLGLADYVQVWPAHGAGSACGKALGAVPSSTVGYERRFNPAFARAEDEGAFVDFILADQPEPPMYFARMKAWNRDGVPILGGLPRPAELSGEALAERARAGATIIDVRTWEAFRNGHVPGSLWGPPGAPFHMAIGSYAAPSEELVLVADEGAVEGIVRDLVRIGLDKVVGWARPESLAGLRGLARVDEIDPSDAGASIPEGACIVDVRSAAEHARRSIPGTAHHPYTRLPERLDEIPTDEPIVVHCRTGVRSGASWSYLSRSGRRVINLAGGIERWAGAGRPVSSGDLKSPARA